jgi:hypothetical protein
MKMLLILLLGCPQNVDNNIEQGETSDYYELDTDSGDVSEINVVEIEVELLKARIRWFEENMCECPE